MGLMIAKTCRVCGDRVLVTRQETRGVGRPYARCTNCNAMILLGSRNEWSLKSPRSRAAYIVGQCYMSFLLPVALVVLVGFALWVFAVADPIKDAGLLLFLIGACLTGILFGLYRAVVRIQDDIGRSDRRMRNTDYRSRLKKMGLLQDAEYEARLRRMGLLK